MVFYEETIEKLSEMQKEDALKTIQSQISFCNWKLAIEAYQLARGNAINGGSEKILKQIQQFKKDRIYSEVTDDSPKFR